MKSAPTSRDELRSLIERVQNLETEIKELNADKSSIYKEAKGKGFDVAAMKAVIAYLRKDAANRQQRDQAFELYLSYVVGTENATRAGAAGDIFATFATIPDPVPCPPVRQQTDGAAVSNSPASPSDTAAIIPQPVPSVSPRAEHDGGALPVPHAPPGDAPTNSDGSEIIPLCLRRSADGGFVQV